MGNYNYNSVVSKTEAEALKEMIFKRVRERAEKLNEDTQNSYTTSMRADIMEIARDSFVANKNPFSFDKTLENTAKEKEPEEVKEARKKADEIREQINNANKTASENIANSAAREAMNEARESLHKKTSFMGALEFLNSQATIELVHKSGKHFNAIA